MVTTPSHSRQSATMPALRPACTAISNLASYSISGTPRHHLGQEQEDELGDNIRHMLGSRMTRHWCMPMHSLASRMAQHVSGTFAPRRPEGTGTGTKSCDQASCPFLECLWPVIKQRHGQLRYTKSPASRLARYEYSIRIPVPTAATVRYDRDGRACTN